jgi:hypothetical protein
VNGELLDDLLPDLLLLRRLAGFLEFPKERLHGSVILFEQIDWIHA